jgi:hypothetical protein
MLISVGFNPTVEVPLKRLELLLSAPEADALSTELQGRGENFTIKGLCGFSRDPGTKPARSVKGAAILCVSSG